MTIKKKEPKIAAKKDSQKRESKSPNKLKPQAGKNKSKSSAPKEKTRTAVNSKTKGVSRSKNSDNFENKPTVEKKRRNSSKSADRENRVREIANKNKVVKLDEKKESKGFSLDDVRSILKSRSNKSKTVPATNIESSTKATNTQKVPTSTRRRSAKVKKLQTASIDDILGFGSSLGSKRPIRDESKVPKEWFTYYKDLMTLRASLKGALGERSSETIGASAREASGELSLNSSDAGTETFDRDVALSMVASEQEALEEIEDAIDRIFDGTYGICQETKKPIKKNRLKVVPFTRFSLEGQNLSEKRKTRERDSGGGAFATISDSTMGEDG